MPLSEQQLLERDRQRDLNAELLQSVDEMLTGCTVVQHNFDLPDEVSELSASILASSTESHIRS